jgi:hypothetical protein
VVCYKSNLNLINGHEVWGLSGTGTVSMSEKADLFVRDDYATSVIPAGNTIIGTIFLIMLKFLVLL